MTRPIRRYWKTCLALLAVLFPLILNAAAVPAPERLLPDDTLLVVTVPDFGKMREIYKSSPLTQLWLDPAMKPFRDKFVSNWNDEFIKPLERELNVSFAQYTSLLQGQLTFAVTQNGWQGDADHPLGFVLLMDTKDKSGQLKTNLTELRKKWIDADKSIRAEKIRDFEFSIVSLSSNDIPKTLRRFFPKPLEYHELGEEAPKKAPAKSELVVGQADSLLILGNSTKVVERVVARLTGGTVPCLGEQAAYDANHQALFRDAPFYGWANAKVFLDVLARKSAEKKENPQAPNPLEDLFNTEKLLGATGLLGLKTVAFNLKDSNEGSLLKLFLGVPEATRAGVFKILAGEAKESNPPPFVPADVIKFQRWRIDGQKAWAILEKMLTDISPQSLNTLNFLLDTANQAAKDKDPGFDVRKSLIGNLGDDIMIYEKAPRSSTAADLEAAPSVVLLGSPNAGQLAASLKNIFIFMTAQAGSPSEREFLGRKVFSAPLPALPVRVPGASKPSSPRTLHYAASGGYVAFSTDVSTLEEYLRSSESQGKALRETPGLAEAAQKVTGPGTSFFQFENQAESMRVLFDVLKKDSGASTNVAGLNLLSSVPGMTTPEQSFKNWMDFSLLPSFDKISKYFHFAVSGGSSTIDGLTYKIFAPVPPGLRSPPAAK